MSVHDICNCWVSLVEESSCHACPQTASSKAHFSYTQPLVFVWIVAVYAVHLCQTVTAANQIEATVHYSRSEAASLYGEFSNCRPIFSFLVIALKKLQSVEAVIPTNCIETPLDGDQRSEASWRGERSYHHPEVTGRVVPLNGI